MITNETQCSLCLAVIIVEITRYWLLVTGYCDDVQGVRASSVDGCQHESPCRHSSKCLSTDQVLHRDSADWPSLYSTFQGPVCECDHTGYKGIYCEQGEFIIKLSTIKKILGLLKNENVQKLTLVSWWVWIFYACIDWSEIISRKKETNH